MSGEQPTRPPLRWLLVGILIGAWLARDVLVPFVLAGAIAYAFEPAIDAAVRRTALPRRLIVIVGYLAALVLIGIGLFVLGGKVAAEFQRLGQQGPNAVAYALRQLLGSDTLQIGTTRISVSDLAQQVQIALSGVLRTPSDALHVAGVVADVTLQALLTLIVTFYLLLDWPQVGRLMLRFVPEDRRPRTLAVTERVHVVLGKWLRGQLLLIVLVSLVVYIVLGPILHLPYALAIGIASGVLEIIPLVGPLAAGGLAAIVALTHGGPGLALSVAVFYAVLRQVEDQLVMPIVIGRAVHLHPVVTILAVLVGLSTWGILGGLLAVPLAAALNVLLNEIYPAPPEPEDAGGTSEAGGGTADASTALGPLPEPEHSEGERA